MQHFPPVPEVGGYGFGLLTVGVDVTEYERTYADVLVVGGQRYHRGQPELFDQRDHRRHLVGVVSGDQRRHVGGGGGFRRAGRALRRAVAVEGEQFDGFAVESAAVVDLFEREAQTVEHFEPVALVGAGEREYRADLDGGVQFGVATQLKFFRDASGHKQRQQCHRYQNT